MARPKCIKLKEGGFFYIMSGTEGQDFYLSDVQKVNGKKYD